MTTRVLSVTCCERNSLELCADGVTVRTPTTEQDGSAHGTMLRLPRSASDSPAVKVLVQRARILQHNYLPGTEQKFNCAGGRYPQEAVKASGEVEATQFRRSRTWWRLTKNSLSSDRTWHTVCVCSSISHSVVYVHNRLKVV